MGHSGREGGLGGLEVLPNGKRLVRTRGEGVREAAAGSLGLEARAEGTASAKAQRREQVWGAGRVGGAGRQRASPEAVICAQESCLYGHVSRPARARGQKLFFPGSLPPVKNAFITEAETVKAGTKFIVRDSTITSVGRAQRNGFALFR